MTDMVRANSTRVDLAERFQKLIDEYNSGSHNVEALFAELVRFARDLSEEEKRGVAEGLDEEELALFDILTKPEPTLTKKEEAAVKKVCRELLATLKREKFVQDWRTKQQTRADVEQTIKVYFRDLPVPYSSELKKAKRSRAFAHVYDRYSGASLGAGLL